MTGAAVIAALPGRRIDTGMLRGEEQAEGSKRARPLQMMEFDSIE